MKESKSLTRQEASKLLYALAEKFKEEDLTTSYAKMSGMYQHIVEMLISDGDLGIAIEILKERLEE